ncbi:uncharacterized protein APUU_31422S [Aspergillus puulaauensis]|uniref:Uncharacterized protein n=1 Tax=Aspergillus puulaauensis TaxID=1220207 RepID=A0A7R7XKK3_9EURO|nr:uncharacterized protein APUU_31422S [Aspergillus puulaauensis]BCS23197.1 hypothetical protein APUU_31422S [Aspergillus puulaauensis]
MEQGRDSNFSAQEQAVSESLIKVIPVARDESRTRGLLLIYCWSLSLSLDMATLHSLQSSDRIKVFQFCSSIILIFSLSISIPFFAVLFNFPPPLFYLAS